MTYKDYVGNPLAVGMRVCTGWRTSDERKRTGRIVWFYDGFVITDGHGLALESSEVLRCADERDTAAIAAYPEGSVVTTTVHSIGGRSELVAGTVTGHKRGQLVVQTDCHGTIMVPLCKVER